MRKSLIFLLLVLLLRTSVYADNRETIVHVTETGNRYHRAGCSYLKSDIPITLEKAVRRGNLPCSRCDPPEPDFSALTQIPETPAPHLYEYPVETSVPISVTVQEEKSDRAFLVIGGLSAAGTAISAGMLISEKRRRR